ncbi:MULTISPECIES: hypothetical protein [Bacillus]|uniref:SunI/YnzG family protein n=1 Tax=Bacillus TaxID=1386 RepID=UPI000B52C3F5|nr:MULTISPECIES: hypothetical protein [Bacillus]MDK7443806.1 hypothetical protein [Bacillus paranthracis]MDK7460220.1 hypothetical protein [Bacillus paranthracis]OWW09423.1 hypothetical protein BUE63_15370 [Bacillus sp. MB353a]HDR7495193.1 hypothetical protein [Bacillus cereus]
MEYKFKNDEIILSPLFSKVVFKKEDITAVSIPTDYAPSNGTLIGAVYRGMDTVMLHTKKGNYYFYINNPEAFVKKVQDFCVSAK